eukprot:8804570-Pyramimonas_sp.AAC.1
MLSPWQNQEIKKQLTEYINKGYLQPSHSPWGAPDFLVKKPHSREQSSCFTWTPRTTARISSPRPFQDLFIKISLDVFSMDYTLRG